ncbi:Sodium/calcium exchanger 2 [Saguinus oedipus]|uniref:Sodium/calcium exchanger 2 n=1 Tax=Saguinus oedipus TaxID=9490 RepID=A0ABQ9VF53_SAGOE|nr:Sodium/calcium exchanger 2 [Saguinus oedipus]
MRKCDTFDTVQGRNEWAALSDTGPSFHKAVSTQNPCWEEEGRGIKQNLSASGPGGAAVPLVTAQAHEAMSSLRLRAPHRVLPWLGLLWRLLLYILVIGLLTALIGDLASHFGCTVGLKDSVNPVVFVALDTSIPDTFASKVAALQDQCADASIGNVTGSNTVNMFLGLGVARSVAAVYWAVQGRPFEVRTGTLAFSVTLFTVFAFVGITVLLYLRRPHISGELGDPRGPKLATTALFLGLWLLYILFASLEVYCHIRGF